MASTDALPVPQKNVAYRVVFPILDADGDLVTGATGLDSEVSKDQGTFADCTNEATEIATSSGVYYLDLTSTEMNADCVAVIVKTTSSGAKTTTLVLYPQEAADIKVDVTHWLGTAAATPTVAGVPEVDVTHWLGTAAATPTVAGVPEVDATHWLGTALATPDTTGYPKVTIKDGTGTGEIDTASGRVAITEAQIDQIVDETWDEARSGHTTDGTFGQVNQAVRSGTAQGGGTNTVTLDASASATDDLYNGCLVWIVAGTGAGQAGVITDYVGSTKVATVDNNWRTNPDNTSVFVLLPGSLGLTSSTLAGAVWNAATASHATAGTFGLAVADTLADTTVIGTPAGASVSADIASIKTDTGTTIPGRLPAALVGGRMDANVGAISSDATAADNAEAFFDGTGYAGTNNVIPTVTSVTAIATGGITAGSIAADAIGASELAADAVAEIQSGLATAANLATLTAYVDTEVAAIKAKTDNLPASPAATGDAMTLTSGERSSVADAVWEEAIADHSGTSGSTAEQLAAAGAGGDPWATAVPGSYTTGQAGKVLADILDDTGTSGVVSVTGNVGGNVVGSVASVTGAVGSVTGNVGGNVVGSVASVTGAVGSVTGNVGGNVTGNLGGTLTSTERNAIADALLNRGLDGAGASSRKVREALAFMRNKWSISGTTLTVYDVDDTTSLFTATITSASGNPVTGVDPA